MNPDATEEGRRWLLQAEQDLDDARYNLEGSRYHLTCFLAQQSAEKALKAFLYARGEESVWGIPCQSFARELHQRMKS